MIKNLSGQYGFSAYLLVATIHIASILFNLQEIRFITKPLLMPILALAVYGCSPVAKERSLIIIALLFSFLGDVFLMFDDKNALYFILGLLSFLTTHVLYIIYFLQIKPLQVSLLQKHPWIIALIVLYGVGLVYLLYPSLGALKIPVIIYATIICSMLLASIHIYNRVNAGAGLLLVAGAIFFVISDSILAINKFHAPFSAAAVIIMATYCAAQYCIARGFVKAKRNN